MKRGTDKFGGRRQVSIDPRWRVDLEGEAEDIAELTRLLNEGATSEDGFFVFPNESGASMIVTTRWDKIDDPSEILSQASYTLSFYSALLNVFDAARSLKPGTIREVTSEGETMRRMTTLQIVVKRAEAERIKPQHFAKIVASANENEWLFSALKEMAPPADWYSVFRCIEYIEVGSGGTEKSMIDNPLVDGRRLKLIKRMANSVRHAAGGSHSPPVPPISLEDALVELRRTLTMLSFSTAGIIEHANPPA